MNWLPRDSQLPIMKTLVRRLSGTMSGILSLPLQSSPASSEECLLRIGECPFGLAEKPYHHQRWIRFLVVSAFHDSKPS